jgi:hypothetical protein
MKFNLESSVNLFEVLTIICKNICYFESSITFYQASVILFGESVRKFVKAVKMKLSVFVVLVALLYSCHTNKKARKWSIKRETNNVKWPFYSVFRLCCIGWREGKKRSKFDLDVVTRPCEWSSSILHTYAYIFSSQATVLHISYLVPNSD